MATDFTSQITGYYQAIQYRTPPAAELATYNAALQAGTLTTTQVIAGIENSPYTVNYVNAVIREYQAAFGRVPDVAGVTYWTGVVASNPSALANLNTIFASSTEFTARYGATATTPANPALVTSLYTNVLGRAPDAAGLAYWSSQNLTAAQLLQSFAQSPEFVTNTTSYITAYQNAAAAGTAPTSGSLFLVPGGSPSSSNFVFTTGIDNLVGTNGTDTFTGDNTGTTATVTAGDAANGTTGTDTFNYYVSATGGAVVFPQLSSVEIVNLLGAPGGQTFNTSTVTDLTNLTLKSPSSTTGGDTFTVASGTTVGFDTVNIAGTETVTFSGATTGNISLSNGSKLAQLTVSSGPTALAIKSSGSAANTITTLATTGVTGLTITGDKGLTITNSLNAAINTVDGSTATGALKFTLGATTATTDSIKTGSGADVVNIASVGADAVTVALGAGNDTLITGSALATFTTGTAIDGGEGTDIINIASGASFTKAAVGTLSNFETLDVSGASGTFDTTLAQAAGAFTAYQSDASIGGAHGALTFSNVASTGFVFSEIASKGVNVTNTSLTVTLKDATGTSDAATLKLTATDGNNDATANGQVTLTTFTATGIENVTIGSSINGIDTGLKATSYTNTITTLTDANLATLTINGNANLTIGDLTSATAITKVDAGASSGNITLDLSASTKSVAYTGSTGIDTVTIGDKGGSFYGAGGNDVITLTAAHATAESLVYKASGDTTQTVASGATVITAASSLETITNYQSIADAAGSNDTIDVTNLGFTGVARGIAQLGAITDPTGGTFNASQANFFVDAGGTRGVAVGTVGGNTYVFIDADHDGNFSASSDLVVRLVGTHTLATGDFAF